MSRFRSLFLGALGIALGTAVPAGAAVKNPLLTVETATVEAGRTVISGKTAVAGATVSIAGTEFTVKSDIRRTFRFSLAWLPPSCIATLAIGAQTHPAVVANCAPARPSNFGKIGVKKKTPPLNHWVMVGAGEPVALAAGDPVSVHASFTVAALTSKIPWPDTPPPSNQGYLSTACIKRADNTVLLGDSMRSYGYVHASMVVSTVNQIIVNDKTGTVQVGVCVKADGTNGVTLEYIGGTWFTLN